MAKILIFYQYYCTPKGAWGTRYYEFSRRWVAAGHDVTIVTSIYDRSDLEPGDGLITRTEIEGAKIIAVNLAMSSKDGILKRLYTFASFSLVSSLYALISEADIVIASSGPLSIGLPGLLAKWLRGKPLVFEVRDLWPEGAIELGQLRNPLVAHLARAFERLCYRSAKQVVALSPGMVPYIHKAAPGTNVVTITNAADLDLFAPDAPIPGHIQARTTGKFVALYAGTLGRANSALEFVDLAAELARRGDTDILIVLVGDGIEAPEAKRRAELLRLENLLFVGKVPKTEVVGWHAAAKVILLGLKPRPILTTSSPNKLFDALAAGRPVLTNIDGWIRELLEKADAGLYYAPGDIRMAADKLLSLAHDSARLHAMSANARHVAETEYARDLLAKRYAALFTP